MPEDSLFLMPTTTTSAAVMDRATPHKQQLKCPRCDSANTKFCYYNNYSLTQPRHFCKACKRYWTLGGTLRNVPVGGGCRKNKRLKKPSPATSAADPSEFRPLPPPAPIQNQIDLRPSDLNPFFYALSSDMGNIPMVSCPDNYNLQPPQLQGLGSQSDHQRQQVLDDGDYQSGFIYQFAAAMASSHDYPIPGSASLAEPSLKHARKVDDYLPFDPIDGNLGFLKDVKIEGLPQTPIDWQLPCDHTPLQAIASAAASDAAADSMTEHGDSSFLYWNPIMGNPWSDANYGSSIAPLF